MIETTWSEIKRLSDSKPLPVQWVQVGNNYHIALVDGPFTVYCVIPTDSTHADTAVFEASYKAAGNKKLDPYLMAFAAKAIGTKKLFARATGIQGALTIGSNTITYTIPYPWVKIVGVEVVGCEALDYVDCKVLDSTTGTYSTIPNYVLNQFGFTVNLPAGFYSRVSPFDADLYTGMQLQFIYNSVSAKTIGINFIMSEVK